MNYLEGMTGEELDTVMPHFQKLCEDFPGRQLSLDRVLAGWVIRDWSHRPSSPKFSIATESEPIDAIESARKKLEQLCH